MGSRARFPGGFTAARRRPVVIPALIESAGPQTNFTLLAALGIRGRRGTVFRLGQTGVSCGRNRAPVGAGLRAGNPQTVASLRGDSFRGRQTQTLASEQGGNCPRGVPRPASCRGRLPRVRVWVIGNGHRDGVGPVPYLVARQATACGTSGRGRRSPRAGQLYR